MNRSIRSPGLVFLLAFALVLLDTAPQGRCQDSKPVKFPPAKNSLLDGPPLTGLLLQAEREGKAFDFSSAPMLVGGRPFVYPPATLGEARDDRRVDSDVSVVVTLEKTEYRVMEPISIKVELRNNSNDRKSKQVSNSLYRVAHVNAYMTERYKGKMAPLVPKTLYEKMSVDVAGGVGVCDFPPGRTDHYDLFVNLPNDITWPGEHSFFVEFYTGGLVEIDGKVTPRVARSKEYKVKIVDIPLVIGPIVP